MAYRATGHRSSERRGGSAFWPFVTGVVLTVLIGVSALALYLRYGHPPVAVADAAFPMEAESVHVPLSARIKREIAQPPFGTSEEVYESGARLYVSHCAFCHGTPGHDSMMAKAEYPGAPQLWKKHAKGGVVGVSDDEAGETYWKIKNGIRLTGMPAYQHAMSDAEMWQVTLLLKNADQTLPDPVVRTLTR